MVFDADAVKQVVRPYIGYYLVKAGSVGGVLHYKSDAHDCSVLINCGSGEITVKLNEEYRGKKYCITYGVTAIGYSRVALVKKNICDSDQDKVTS